ncbi:MAG: hypothetical protein AAF690_20740 [Acidobacteriota bacterium]
MTTEQEFSQKLETLEGNLNGFIAASIADIDSGMTLVLRSNRPDFDLAAASAFNSEMVKMKVKTIEALGLNSKLEDMLLTLDDQIHLIKLLDENTFMYLAVDSAQSNLGIVRRAVQNVS